MKMKWKTVILNHFRLSNFFGEEKKFIFKGDKLRLKNNNTYHHTIIQNFVKHFFKEIIIL